MIKFLVRFSTSSTINNRLSRNTRCRRGMCHKIRVATRASPRVTRWVCDLYGVFSSLPLFAALVLPGQHIVLGDKKNPHSKNEFIAGCLERRGQPERHADCHEQHGEVAGPAARLLLLRVGGAPGRAGRMHGHGNDEAGA